MTKNRTAGAAGQMIAGEPFADHGDAPLLDLLNFDSVAEGVKIGDHLHERLAANETAIAAHAAGADDASLAGDDAEREHAERTERLDRERRRFRLAIERADERLAEVADAERKAAARTKLAKAAKAATRAEEIAGTAYPEAARTVAVLLEELAGLQAEVMAARATARDAGLHEEADALQLPHERRFRPEVREEREIVEERRGPSITDAHGRPVRGVSERGGLIPDSNAPHAAERITRIESVIVQRRHAPADIATRRAVLPDPDGGLLLDRGTD